MTSSQAMPKVTLLEGTGRGHQWISGLRSSIRLNIHGLSSQPFTLSCGLFWMRRRVLFLPRNLYGPVRLRGPNELSMGLSANLTLTLGKALSACFS